MFSKLCHTHSTAWVQAAVNTQLVFLDVNSDSCIKSKSAHNRVFYVTASTSCPCLVNSPTLHLPSLILQRSEVADHTGCYVKTVQWQVRGYLPDTNWPPTALQGPLRGPFFQAERRQRPSKREGSKRPLHEPHHSHIMVWNVCAPEDSKWQQTDRKSASSRLNWLSENHLHQIYGSRTKWRLRETKLSQKLVWASRRLHSLWGGNLQEIKERKKKNRSCCL